MPLHGYDSQDKARIAALAAAFVKAQIESGAIELSDEAIRAAMPAAVHDAKCVINAVNEFLCG